MNNFWDTSVWGGINVFAMLLLGLLAASLIKKSIKPLKESLVPTSVLAGFVLLVVSGIYMTFAGESMFYTNFMGGDGFSILETRCNLCYNYISVSKMSKSAFYLFPFSFFERMII